MLRPSRPCRFALLLVPLMAIPHPANAQARSHGYAALGAGATQLDGGVDWVLANGPIGVGGEMGVGDLLMVSVNGSFHPLARRLGSHLDPFAVVGIAAMTDLNYDATGITVGGGATYWPRRRLGLRLDGFAFVAGRDDIRPDHRRHWGLRAGVAIRIR